MAIDMNPQEGAGGFSSELSVYVGNYSYWKTPHRAAFSNTSSSRRTPTVPTRTHPRPPVDSYRSPSRSGSWRARILGALPRRVPTPDYGGPQSGPDRS